MQDKLTVRIGDKDREIFMSYGLLNTLTRVIGDPAVVPAIAIDPDLRGKVLAEVLAERKKSGKVSAAVKDIDDLEISIEDVELLIDWVMEHVMSFFVRRMEKISAISSRHEKTLKHLESSLDGSKGSVSATQ